MKAGFEFEQLQLVVGQGLALGSVLFDQGQPEGLPQQLVLNLLGVMGGDQPDDMGPDRFRDQAEINAVVHVWKRWSASPSKPRRMSVGPAAKKMRVAAPGEIIGFGVDEPTRPDTAAPGAAGS